MASPDGSASRLEHFLKLVPDAIVGVAEPGRIVLANGGAETLFGYPADELRDRPVDELVDAGVLHERPAVGDVRCAEAVVRRRDGTSLPAELRVGAIERDGEIVMLVHIRAVAGHAADAIDPARAQRLEAAVRDAVHDLNNHLGIVMSYAEFALEAAADQPELRADLREVIEAGERAVAVVGALRAAGDPGSDDGPEGGRP